MAGQRGDFAQSSFSDFEPSLTDLSVACPLTETSLQDNFLFAIYPPDDVAKRVHDLAALFCEQCKLTTNMRPAAVLHATLCLLKDPHCVDAALRVGDGIASTAFEVVFDHMLSFGRSKSSIRKYPFVLSCEPGCNQAMHWLQRKLRMPLRRMGLLYERGFTPHVTLFYDSNRINKRAVEPIGWTVTEFALVHSHFGEARHETIRRWKLPIQVTTQSA